MSVSFKKLNSLLNDYERYVIAKSKKSEFGVYKPKDLKFRAQVASGWASDFLMFAYMQLTKTGKKRNMKV